MILDFLRNETALVSAAITAITGLLTGPVFQMDPAAVGSITAVVVVIFNIWVRFNVYSIKGATNVATAVAVEAVGNMTTSTVGTVRQVTQEGATVINDAVDKVLGGGLDMIRPPG